MPRILYLLFVPLVLVSFAAADPLSNCTTNPTNGAIVCHLYEEFGPTNEMSPVVQLPHPVASGFQVLLEHPGIPYEDYTNWSDIVWFAYTAFGANAITVQLFSDPLIDLPFQIGCVLDPISCGYTGLTGYTLETSPPTLIDVGNLYYVYSDFNETEVPEPATLLLFGAGLVGLGAKLRKRLG